MSRRSLIVLLAGLNLVLLASIVLVSWDLPAARAQPAAAAQSYLMVTGQVRRGMDAVYLVDLPKRRIHVFAPNRQQNARRLFHVGVRDLVRDFR